MLIAQGDVRADGADAKEAARWEAQAAAEKAVAEAEAAVARGEPAGRKLLARAERQLEAVLDQALDAEGLGADWDGEHAASSWSGDRLLCVVHVVWLKDVRCTAAQPTPWHRRC